MSAFDLDYFINSTFCKKGSVVFNTDNKNPQFRLDRIIQFDATIPSIKKINSLINDRQQEKFELINIWPSLYNSLVRSTLPDELFNIISIQWQSVLNVINQINIEPEIGVLMIMLPDVHIVTHTHQSNIKQTLTFEFNFPEHNCDSKEESYIRLYLDNKIVNLKKGTSNKTAFTILDNVKHSAYCKNLKFFWVYDFSEHLDLSKVDFCDFEFLNFNI